MLRARAITFILTIILMATTLNRRRDPVNREGGR
jgi:hypothetical protein